MNRERMHPIAPIALAAELFLADTEGKPKQGVELSGPDGKAVDRANMADEHLHQRLTELLAKWDEKR
jgi:hypothetical protein